MKNSQHELGDTPPEEFRRELHELADWIADFRQRMGSLRVAPNDKPGAILAALPAKPPEEGEPFEKILSDIDRVIVPGMVHWSHPMFLGYYYCSCNSWRDHYCATQCERDDLAHMSRRD